jgi:hypothetical protein
LQQKEGAILYVLDYETWMIVLMRACASREFYSECFLHRSHDVTGVGELHSEFINGLNRLSDLSFSLR